MASAAAAPLIYRVINKTIATTVDMTLEQQQEEQPIDDGSDGDRSASTEPPFNFKIRITSTTCRLLDLTPIPPFECQHSEHKFHLSQHNRRSILSIDASIYQIIFKELHQIKSISDFDMMKIAKFIDSKWDELLERKTVVANIHIHTTLQVENVLPCIDMENICPICLEKLGVDLHGDGGRVYRTDCDHMFHYLCICRWLMNKGSCPYCRATLVPDYMYNL